MNTAQHRALITRMLAHIDNGTTDLAAAPLQVAASEFLCPERLASERQRLFLDTPQIVGFAGEIAKPGSYFTATALDIPVLVTRAADGQLRAFINACAHRGAQVADGCGQAKRLTCPFHGWSYHLDGGLAGRRDAMAFAGCDSNTGLVQLPVSDRCGLIVVGLRPEVPQQRVDTALDEIASELSAFELASAIPVGKRRLEVQANWKLVVNLSHEGYHFATAHRQSLAPLMHDNGVVDTFGRHTRWAFALRGIETLSRDQPADWPTHFPGAMNHTIFPGTVIVINPDGAEMIRVEPGHTPDRSIVWFSGVARRADRVDACREAFEFGGKIFAEEDLPSASASHRGIAAGLPNIVIGRNEPLVQYWHQLWDKMLQD